MTGPLLHLLLHPGHPDQTVHGRRGSRRGRRLPTRAASTAAGAAGGYALGRGAAKAGFVKSRGVAQAAAMARHPAGASAVHRTGLRYAAGWQGAVIGAGVASGVSYAMRRRRQGGIKARRR